MYPVALHISQECFLSKKHVTNKPCIGAIHELVPYDIAVNANRLSKSLTGVCVFRLDDPLALLTVLFIFIKTYYCLEQI